MDKLNKILFKIDDLLEAVRIDNDLEEEVVDAYNHGAEAMANQIDHFVRMLQMMKEEDK